MLLLEIEDSIPVSIRECKDEYGSKRYFFCFNSITVNELLAEWYRQKCKNTTGNIGDEAHNFKNVTIETKIKSALGINSTGSKKCRDMMDKVHIVQKQNDGKGVVFAAGTPIITGYQRSKKPILRCFSK